MVTLEAVKIRSAEIPEHNWHAAVLSLTSGGDKKPKWLPKYLVLTIQATRNGYTKKLRVLVDTGATINIIKTGIWPSHHIVRAYQPKMLTNANGGHLSGGSSGTVLSLETPMVGWKGKSFLKTLKGFFYEADIACDAIISYDFLANHRLGVVPHKHALVLWDDFDGVDKPVEPSPEVKNRPVTPHENDHDQKIDSRKEVNRVSELHPTTVDSGCRAALATVKQPSEGDGSLGGYSSEDSSVNQPGEVEDAQPLTSTWLSDSWCRVIGATTPVGFVGGGGEDSSLCTNTKPQAENTRPEVIPADENKNKSTKNTENELAVVSSDTEGRSPHRVEIVSQVETPHWVEKPGSGGNKTNQFVKIDWNRAKIARKTPWVTESYAVIDSWRDQIVEWSQLDMSRAIDAFASHQNRRFDRFWDKKTGRSDTKLAP